IVVYARAARGDDARAQRQNALGQAQIAVIHRVALAQSGQQPGGIAWWRGDAIALGGGRHGAEQLLAELLEDGLIATRCDLRLNGQFHGTWQRRGEGWFSRARRLCWCRAVDGLRLPEGDARQPFRGHLRYRFRDDGWCSLGQRLRWLRG